MKYLARAGKIHGPYEEPELEALRKSGELERYSWIWEPAQSSWLPLDPAPSVAPVETAILNVAAPATVTPLHPIRERHPAPAAAPARSYDKRLEAVCHDFHSVVSGQLRSITDEGCELVSAITEAFEDATAPAFSPRGALVLSILDPRTGKSMNVQTRLTQSLRKEGQWSYRLQWDHCPEIVSA